MFKNELRTFKHWYGKILPYAFVIVSVICVSVNAQKSYAMSVKQSATRALTPADQKRLLTIPSTYKVKLYLIMSKKESAKYGNSIADFLRDHDYNVEVWPEDEIKKPTHALSNDEKRFEIQMNKTAKEAVINVR